MKNAFLAKLGKTAAAPVIVELDPPDNRGQTIDDDDMPAWVTATEAPGDAPAPGAAEFAAALVGLDEDARYELQERAAIAEFDGGLSRPDAERKALAEWRGRAAVKADAPKADPWAALSNLGKKEF